MTPAFGTLRVFADAAALAEGAAAFLCEQGQACAGSFAVCLSGGSTPKRLYELLAGPPWRDRFLWQRGQFVYGDERFVPPDDAASNAGMADAALFSHVSVPAGSVHAIPTVGLTPEQAAQDYEAVLRGLQDARAGRPLFDVCLLGLGEDGHTASLLPGEPVLDERARWVGVVAHGRPETRITLTYPALESSGFVVFLVQGAAKAGILDRLLRGDDSVPAGRLRPAGKLLWFADRAAAGAWASSA